MELLLSLITASFMGYQTVSHEFRNNSLYTFNIDPNTSEIIIMNTQTGDIQKCTKELVCESKNISTLKK